MSRWARLRRLGGCCPEDVARDLSVYPALCGPPAALRDGPDKIPPG